MIDHDTGTMLFQIGIVLMCFLAVRQSESKNTEPVPHEVPKQSNDTQGTPKHRLVRLNTQSEVP